MRYLRYKYPTGPEAGTYDYVGPFETQLAAWKHREQYGPVQSDAVELAEPPTPCMSPEEHATYASRRP